MTVVNTKEFNINQEKYLDLALNEQVFIQRGDFFYVVAKTSKPTCEYKEPDDDLRRAITMDEFKERAHEVVKAAYQRYTNERNHLTGRT